MPEGLISRIISVGSAVVSSLSLRRESHPIDSALEVERFAVSRAAFVAQKKLYGYLKTRIGTRWPKTFEDEVFQKSIKIATVHIYAASLSDLTIHVVAKALYDEKIDPTIKARFAHHCYLRGLRDNDAASRFGFNEYASIAEFDRRLEGTDWMFGALRAENFTRSPAALLKWAPIADELKQFDAEIVENSIKFAWVEVRRDFAARLHQEEVARDVVAQFGNAR